MPGHQLRADNVCRHAFRAEQPYSLADDSVRAFLYGMFEINCQLSTIFSSVHAYGIEYLTVLMHRDLSEEGAGACLP